MKNVTSFAHNLFIENDQSKLVQKHQTFRENEAGSSARKILSSQMPYTDLKTWYRLGRFLRAGKNPTCPYKASKTRSLEGPNYT